MDAVECPNFDDDAKRQLIKEENIEFDVSCKESVWGIPGCRAVLVENSNPDKKIGEIKTYQAVAIQNFLGKAFSFWNSGTVLKVWYITDDDSPTRSVIRGARNWWIYCEGNFPIRGRLRGEQIGDRVCVQQLFFEMIDSDDKAFYYLFFENPDYPYATPEEET